MKVKALVNFHKGDKSWTQGQVFDLDAKTAEKYAEDRLVTEYDAVAEKAAAKDAAKADKAAAKAEQDEEKEKQHDEDAED